MAAVTGPVPAFRFDEFFHAFQEGVIGGSGNIHRTPLVDCALQFRHRAFTPIIMLIVVGEGFVEGGIGWIVTLGYGHRIRQIVAVEVIRHRLKRGTVVIRQFTDEEIQVVLLLRHTLGCGGNLFACGTYTGLPFFACTGDSARVHDLEGEAVQRGIVGFFGVPLPTQGITDVELIEEFTGWIRDVFHDLPTH